MSTTAPARVEVTTFGCRLNIVESDAMRDLATAAGHDGLTIVNTCAVTAEATRQARQAIRRLKRENPERTIAVTGCAATIERHVFAAMPEVGHIVANPSKTDPAIWAALPGRAAPDGLALSSAAPSPGSGGHTRGFLEIQNGCDHRCTFCVIPFGRGASRSIPVADVIARAAALLDTGVREIVLTGVDITSYGGDLDGRPSLGALVLHLLRALPDLPRLRLSSIDCIEADPALLAAIEGEERLMPHLHVSLQSGSDLILKRMKRRHGRQDAVAFCRAVKSLRPGMVLGADIITGFPTETEANFGDSLSLVEACGLTHLHVFPYSPRPNTPAARMPQVPGGVAKERAARLRAAGAAALARHLDGQVGRVLPVLMERGGKGRTPDFSAVRVATAPSAGTIVDVRITGHDGRDLAGVPLGPNTGEPIAATNRS